MWPIVPPREPLTCTVAIPACSDTETKHHLNRTPPIGYQVGQWDTPSSCVNLLCSDKRSSTNLRERGNFTLCSCPMCGLCNEQVMGRTIRVVTACHMIHDSWRFHYHDNDCDINKPTLATTSDECLLLLGLRSFQAPCHSAIFCGTRHVS